MAPSPLGSVPLIQAIGKPGRPLPPDHEMKEISLDRIITEEDFRQTLSVEADMFFRLANTLQGKAGKPWKRRHLYQLVIETDAIEVLMDDHGARHNQRYYFLRELVASIRGFAQAGFAIRHLEYRLDSYGTHLSLYPEKESSCKQSLRYVGDFIRRTIEALLAGCREEAEACGLQWDDKLFPEEHYRTSQVNLKLPRNLGEELIEDEEQKIAEVASKYLQICEMFDGAGIHRITDVRAREAFLVNRCSEERARVYEATVHNLQSIYDTHIKNTTLEAGDVRLSKLRGHTSAAFHLLEAVTLLVHFVERHEGAQRVDGQSGCITDYVDRAMVRDITLNHLLFWCRELIELGRGVARDILSSFTNVQELEVEVPEDMVVHARPASLIVGIVEHYGTPVEMEVAGSVCNAGSILEVMITVGSHPDKRVYVFRGDENPLRDIRLLFEAGLGETGLSKLPGGLSYLKGK